MTRKTQALAEEIAALPETERAELACWILQSLEAEPGVSQDEIDKAWEEEIDRRLADIDSGRAVCIDADEALRQLRQRCK